MVSALVSGSLGLDLTPDQGHLDLFFLGTVYSRSACLFSQVYNKVTGQLNAGDPVMG